MSDNPDEIITHTLGNCDICGASLEDVPPENYIIRQVIDIQDTEVEVIEHREEVKRYPKCRRRNTGTFPKGVTNTVQYSTVLKIKIIYVF